MAGFPCRFGCDGVTRVMQAARKTHGITVGLCPIGQRWSGIQVLWRRGRLGPDPIERALAPCGLLGLLEILEQTGILHECEENELFAALAWERCQQSSSQISNSLTR